MSSVSLPLQVLLGIAFGLIAGIVPAFLVGVGSFLGRNYWDYTLPQVAAVAFALPVVGLNAHYIGLVAEGPLRPQAPRLMVATLVAVMLALYATSQGDQLAESLPRDLSQASRSERTLSAAAIDDVDGLGQVTVRASGDIREFEGYEPLPPDLRSDLADGAWRLPADLPLPELEGRLEEQLRTDYDLADVAVSIDGRGRASVTAAPPERDLARRVPDGWRAVTVDALVPTGLAVGDEVDVHVPEHEGESIGGSDGTTSGRVLSFEVGGEGGGERAPIREPGEVPTGGAGKRPDDVARGGPGRVTVGVKTADAGELLDAERVRLVVASDGASEEFEALSLLEEAGYTVRKLTVDGDELAWVAESDAMPIAVQDGERGATEAREGWTVDPPVDELEPGRTAFVVSDPRETPDDGAVADGGGRA